MRVSFRHCGTSSHEPGYTERTACSDESAFRVTYCQSSLGANTGANTLRFTPTDPDPAGPSLQVKGSPFDSLRPSQTPDSCLGVKGSPVQIRPSRRFFERLYPKLGTKSAMIVPTWPSGTSDEC